MAAVLGGTQSLHTNGKDEALALPTEESARTALRTQQIIAFESGVADTVDPLAGSYFVEYLTGELARRAELLIEEIDALGGAVHAIERGFYQQRIAASAYDWQKKVESKEEIVVGVNEFAVAEPIHSDVLKIDARLEREQIERLQHLRGSREPTAVERSVAAVERTARDGGNVMPAIITAVESMVTLGEISDTLRRVFGEYHE
jgi:methylmalonyl-CoA mutase N-terminal domain/subunit